MTEEQTLKETILCISVLVETSPQALPMGAACITSALKNDQTINCDFNIELKSFSLEEINSNEEIIDEIKNNYSNLKYICFSVYVWNRNVLEYVAKRLKEEKSTIICIAGGPEVTANPESFINFDYTVAGEGELSVLSLIKALRYNGTELLEYKKGFAFNIQGVYDCKKIDNINKYSDENNNYVGFKGDKALKLNVIRSITPDVSLLSSPWLDNSIDPVKYGGVLWELARGCPFKCSYCYESKGEKKIQYFPMERLEKELELFAKLKIPQAFVLDPTYNANKKKALYMLNLIKQKAPDMFFYFEARAEFIDRELARAFASVPCCIQIGLQSSNIEVLKKVHRTLDKKLFIKNIGYLNEEGAVFGFDLIYGLPGDNLAGFKNSIDFALSLYPNNLELFCLSVLPGTTLYEEGTELGLTWEKATPYHVVESTTFSKKELFVASRLAQAVNVFYTQGRAVPWFNTILYPLHIKASIFFGLFADYLEDEKSFKNDNRLSVLHHQEIEELQVSFVKKIYKEKHLDKLINIAVDLIRLNGALSRCTSDCTESIVELNYHPDDVMSEYSSDLVFFSKNAKLMKCKAKVFISKNGPDWKKI